jgi:nucleotide-binding universal stress UspA family protein
MKIVSAVDFSTASENILRITKTYAKQFNAEVFLIHAEPLPNGETPEDYDTKPEFIRLKKDALALEKAGVKTTPVFLQGSVCDVILKKAAELKADIIITGAHGHGGMSCKVPVGHISECILLRSKIPVLVVPAL